MNSRKIDLAEIRAITSKGYTEPYVTSLYFIRYFSPIFSALLVRWRVSANFVTIVSLIFALAGSFLQASNDLFLPFLGAIFLLVYNILDHIDGEVARANFHFYGKTSGLGGSYFDALVHYFYTPVLFLGIGIAAFSQTENELGLWAGLVTGMWLSAYGQSASFRVMMDKIFKDQEIPTEFSGIYQHDKVNWKEAPRKQKIRFLFREIFSNQGQIFILLACTAFELWVSASYSLRFMYLYAMAIIGLIQMFRVSYKFYKVLERIK
ncbi:MAG: CDP-alcohol phosphatidyltransferase family protein [Rhodoferax sp.]|uniref:CDP-alcohol phosphatidyltransferase family protein n=1 Tax=Rhodoferax sp. TaxID=50421 RepID=UPI002613E51B|nr:CDP-alcohol phosphatidyltransferase family protein [Rhodoferax sp.]MDD5332949.1 CDP-alcohol phosphatidyltransferase family protein [Rhodoferax sp.]